MTRLSPRSWPFWLFTLLLIGWAFWLRAPSFDAPMWNTDETVHRAVAKEIIAGEVLYRDMVDHRAPVSYYLTAALFTVTGPHLAALRFAVTLMIVACALAVGWLARRQAGNSAGAVASLTVVGFSCGLLIKEDAFAAHTEWFVMFFSTSAAFVFWTGRGAIEDWRRAGVAGAALGLAVMSKQSALLEVGAPTATLLLAAATGVAPWRRAMGSLLALAGALALVVGAQLAYFGMKVGWAEFWYQFWTYNVAIYGPEIPIPDRLFSALPWLGDLAQRFPLVLMAGLGGAVMLALRVVQLQQTPAQNRQRPMECYQLLWAGLALGSAMSGGRGFGHYLIVCFPAFAWAAGSATGRLVAWIHRRWHNSETGVRAATIVIIGSILFSVLWVSPRQRAVAPPQTAINSPGVPLIKALTVPDDPIFVWGFNPQIYAFTDRRPASRYLYCSFPTGLVPWTNTALEVDTRYAIVPGALENLIADLAATEPKVVMDYAITPGREFGKYPVSDFPALDAWLSPRYGVIDRTALEPHAYRVLVRLDWEDETLADTWQPTERPVASIVSNGRLQTGLNHLLVNAYSADADVTGIGLWVQGRGVCRLELPATDLREWTIPVEVTDPARPLTLVPLVRRGEGPWQTGAPLEGQVLDLGVTDAQAQEFAIPVATTFEPAAGLKLSFDGMVELKPGRRDYAMHAPNIMRHRLPEGAVAVHGLFQIAAGAYAPENPSPSDGATFIVRLVQPSGQATELFRRLLEPGQRAEDRGLQPLGIRLPPDGVAGSQIEFEIDNGPGGVANSDWTSWVNLVIETSP